MNESLVRILPEGAPEPLGPYTPAIRIGSMLHTSGQIGLEDAGSLSGNVSAETKRALSNLGDLLRAGGASPATVVKTTIYLIDMADFAVVNEIYGAFFDDARPARSTVEVAGLPKGALVEIEAVALCTDSAAS